ncbi:adenosylcobinamide-phosphate synthase CbiB [Neptuniibacter sp. UBA847]|uniref:adenosylcobinamide-phosphate synthase CbiB n=2 Tax=unclassified Neptuniibacter TaxID=2630693 RepID=UPI0025F6175C|nr:adenosylcobinamide-phosphate synthase CbiB [Neptuniibacter sp. UBA847]|tara:strand:+ start:968 stop:1942 length:975 start_codon:yes stop_codon:yes gene_type:complete
MTIALSVLIALVLDYFFKEPKRFHPLVGFGNWVSILEKRLRQGSQDKLTFLHKVDTKQLGMMAWCIAVIPIVIVGWSVQFSLSQWPIVSAIFGGIVLYLCIGWQSLLGHALAIATPLKEGNMVDARQAVGMIVSRDTSELSGEAIASAATESVLENGADAIYSAIFWFCLLGIPGVILYRLSNTLDAMWGYKSERYLQFGWCAARMDDLLNYVPARLTALSYSLLGDSELAFKAWRQQAKTWKSPNAGPVMASGAGAINVSLGGAAIYHGELQQRPALGPEEGEAPSAKSIEDACELVNHVLVFWIAVIYFVTAVVVSVQSSAL